MAIKCGLIRANEFCKIWPGVCCAACAQRSRCRKACQNEPERCGYSVDTEETFEAWRSRREAMHGT